MYDKSIYFKDSKYKKEIKKSLNRKSFNIIIIQNFMKQLKQSIYIIILVLIGENLLKKGIQFINCSFINNLKNILNLDIELFSQFLICGIGVAGVFLALYYSNIATIYSTEYTNAPLKIRELFENEIIGNKSLNDIIQYLILAIVLLCVMILGINIWYMFIILIIIKTINIIINFIIKGNKIYNYSNLYNVLQINLAKLIFFIKNATYKGYQNTDGNFQKHYNSESQKIFDDMMVVNNYVLDKNDKVQASSVANFIGNNLLILDYYFRVKNTILFNSLWFQQKLEYKKWYSADFTAKSLALNTGTELYPSYTTNTNWFEENILLINNKSINFLIDNSCYKELIHYINILVQISPMWIEFGDVNLLMQHIKELSLKIQEAILISETKETTDISNVLEMLCYLYKQSILNFRKYVMNMDSSKIDELYKIKFTVRNFQKLNNKIFNCPEVYKIYQNLKNELDIEKRLITPLWYIKQRVSKEYINEINDILKITEQLYILNLELENKFFESGNYTYSSSFIINENEMHNKIMFFSEEIKACIEDIMKNDIQKEYQLQKPNLDKFVETINNIHKNQVPDAWEKHSKIWIYRANKDERDVFGFCYNNLCEYIFGCIINFDFENFSKHYKILFALSIISEIEINENLKDTDLNANTKFNYQISGLNILFKISGYAIIVGDILGSRQWKELIDNTLENMLIKNPDKKEKGIEQIKRWKNIIDILANGFLFMTMMDVTNMERRFSEAIEKSNKLEFENVGPFGHKKIVNSKNLEQLYYDIDRGFSADMREVYAMATLNKYLPAADKYNSKKLKLKEWEDIND